MSTGAEQALESGGGAMTNLAETEETTLIGTTLDGAYRITRLLAKGGMSAVYEAIQLRLSQRVAVKVMARELAANPEALARFRREAEITSRLRHPHLVTVMDFGTAPAGQPYLVMEYLDGIDLDRRIRATGRLPLATVVHITGQVASALAAAHDQGIVHRDLKPANVFLLELPGEPDFAKILDFGISKVRAATTQLTRATSIIGTPNYMAPEQATGMLDEIDQRTDQWALACIAWEMLSGRTPFASDDMSAVFYQVIHLDPPPLGKRAPDLPAAVEAVLRRALSKTMADRFSSIREFANALASAASGQPIETTLMGMAQTRSGVPASPDGAPWIERRQARRERRRTTPSTHDAQATAARIRDGELATAASVWSGRRRRRLYAVAAIAAGLGLGTLVSLRWNAPAEATGRRVPSTVAVVPSAPSAPPAASVASAPTEDQGTAPAAARESHPSHASLNAVSVRSAMRATKRRPASSAALVRDLPDPFAPARRPDPRLPTKAARPHKDLVDPFAPPHPAGKPAGQSPDMADTESFDPFAS